MSKAWDHGKTTTERGYGWQWRKTRTMILDRDDHLCQPCRALGKLSAAEQVDHITRKADGGTDEPDNLQSICVPCHEAKTLLESAGNYGSAHPTWLPKPACEVVLVCGPPGGGKTTYAKSEARGGDTVIDLDDCMKAVADMMAQPVSRIHLGAALALRNKIIAQLEHKTEGRAFLIVSAPTLNERAWWRKKLNATIMLIDPGLSVITKRKLTEKRKGLAKLWYHDRDKAMWNAPKPKKRQIGPDGYPVH